MPEMASHSLSETDCQPFWIFNPVSNFKLLHFTILGTERGSLSDDLGFLHCSNYDTMKTNASGKAGQTLKRTWCSWEIQITTSLTVTCPITYHKARKWLQRLEGKENDSKRRNKSTTWWPYLLETEGRKLYFISSHSLTHIWCPPPAGHLPLHQLRVPTLLPSYEQVFKGSAPQFWMAWPASL